MKQQHLFLLDPLEKLNLNLDSSLRIAAELLVSGHQVWGALISDLSWSSASSRPFCRAFSLNFLRNQIRMPESVSETSLIALSEFSAIHMRKEPPVDLRYVSATWLLDRVSDSVHVYNSPEMLRSFNEKVGILNYPDEIAPALLTSDYQQCLSFIVAECSGDAIIKPLDLFGGQGVFRMVHGDKVAEERLRQELASEARLIQPFDRAVFHGEIRAFTLGGRAISWCLKKPATGSFLANTAAGATLHSFTPSSELKNKIERVATDLYSKGVSIAGFDIIGQNISEINITSPRLLCPSDDLYNYYEEIADWITNDCKNSHG